MTDTIELNDTTQILDRADVCVVGGGLAGVATALRTVEAGLDTVLVEERGALGWEVSHGLEIFLAGTPPPPRLLDWVARLEGQNAFRNGTFDVCALEILLDSILAEAGVRFHFRAFCSTVNPDGNVAFVTTKSGLLTVVARAVVDATEGSRVARNAGVPVEQTAAGEGQPTHSRALLVCDVTPPAAVTVHELPGGVRATVSPTIWPDEAHVRVEYAVASRTPVESESRKVLALAVESLRASVPGFAKANLSLTGHETFELKPGRLDLGKTPQRMAVAGPRVLGAKPSIEQRVELGEAAAQDAIAAIAAQPAATIR